MFRDYGKEIDELEKDLGVLRQEISKLQGDNEVYYGEEKYPSIFGGMDSATVKDKLEALYIHFNLEFNKTKSGIAEAVKPKKEGGKQCQNGKK